MKKLLALCLMTALAAAPALYAQDAAATDKDKKPESGMKKAAKTGEKDTEKAAKATGHAAKVAAKDTGKAAEKTGAETKKVAKVAAKDTEKGAEKTGSEMKKGVKKVEGKKDDKPADTSK